MGILAKIILTILVSVVVVLCSLGVLFIYLLVEIKTLARKRKELQKELTKEEIKLLELRNLITEFTEKVNDYIYVLSMKKEVVKCKECNCKSVLTGIDCPKNAR